MSRHTTAARNHNARNRNLLASVASLASHINNMETASTTDQLETLVTLIDCINDLVPATSISEHKDIHVNVCCVLEEIKTLGCNPEQVKVLVELYNIVFDQTCIRLSVESMHRLWDVAGAAGTHETLHTAWNNYIRLYDDLIDAEIPGVRETLEQEFPYDEKFHAVQFDRLNALPE
jgi:hypothetical protein